MRSFTSIPGSLFFLCSWSCTGPGQDTAAPIETETAEPDTDTGPEPYSDCETLHWRTEADILLTHQEQVDAFCFEWNAIDGNLTIDLDGDPDSPIWELDGISCLCEVTGDVEIFWIPDYNPDGGASASSSFQHRFRVGLVGTCRRRPIGARYLGFGPV